MSKKFFRDVDTVAERQAAQPPPVTTGSSAALASDEIIVWQGRPKRGFAASNQDWLLIPFSLFWAGFAFNMIAFQSPNLPPNRQASSLHIAVLIWVALYMTIGRFLVDALYRSRLRYIVTSKRVLLIDGLRGRTTAVDRRALQLKLVEHSNGRGTISLREGGTSFSWLNKTSLRAHACLWRPPHLFRIRDARAVYALLKTGPS